jgi:lipoate-protein ligase A
VIRLERWSGTAAEHHGRDVPTDTELAVWQFDVRGPAVALGSRQSTAVVDEPRCRAEGVEVAVRRSGGGAVLLVPGEHVWVDVVVPGGHPLWRDDIGASMMVVGERWTAALSGLVGEPLTVHDGPMLRSPWSELVCFDGIGIGEVLAGGLKLVGISQRRTRHTARFQCIVHLVHEHRRLASLLAPPLPDAPHLEVATLPRGLDPGLVVARLVDAFG